MAQSTDNKSTLRKWLPYGIVILIAALAVLLVALLTKEPEEPEETTTAEPTGTSETETEEVLPTASAIDVGQIELLMERYYRAKVENDVDTLNGIIESDVTYTLADLTGESQYIDRYDGFRNYVVPGPSEEYFVVYVTYDLYFRGIDTGAPSLNRFIVAKDTGGNYFIYDRKVTQDFEAYLQELDATPTISGLRDEVEARLRAARASDKDLDGLITLLTSEPEAPSSTEKESGGSAALQREL